MNLNIIKTWRQLSRKQRLPIVLLVIVAISAIGFSVYKKDKNQDMNTLKITRGNISTQVKAGGNLSAGGEAPIYSQTVGIIDQIYVKNGDIVVTGQKLFRVKSTATPQEKAQAYANYMASVSNFNGSQQNKILFQSQLEAARQQVITASNNVTIMNDNINAAKNNPLTGKAYTNDDKEAIYSALTSARQNFTALEKKYTQADQNINAASSQKNAYWDIYQATIDADTLAPNDGNVANLFVQTGDRVNAYSAAGANTAVLYLLGSANYSLKVELNEFDISQIQPGQKTEVVFDAFPNDKFEGSVAVVDSLGKKSNAAVTYNARIDLTNLNEKIKPGMTATATIITGEKENVLIIPNSAIVKKDNATYVQVKENDTVVEKPITLGVRGNTESEIVEGIEEGTTIVTTTK